MSSPNRFFDLYANDRKSIFKSADVPPDPKLAGWRQFLIYLGCLAGIFIGPYAIEILGGNSPDLKTLFGSPLQMIASALIAFVLIAGIFKMKLISAKTAFVIQMGTSIIAGMIAAKLLPVILTLFSGAVGQ